MSFSLRNIKPSDQMTLVAINSLFDSGLHELLHRYSIKQIDVPDLYTNLETVAVALSAYSEEIAKTMKQESSDFENFVPININAGNKQDIYKYIHICYNSALTGCPTYFIGDTLNMFKMACEMMFYRDGLPLDSLQTIPFSGNMFDKEKEDMLMSSVINSEEYLAAYADILKNNPALNRLKMDLVSGRQLNIADYINFGKGIKTLLFLLYNDPDIGVNIRNVNLLLWYHGSDESDMDDVEASNNMIEMLLDFLPVDYLPAVTVIIMSSPVAHYFTNSERYLQRCTPKYEITKWRQAPSGIYDQNGATLYLQCNVTKYLFFIQLYGLIESISHRAIRPLKTIQIGEKITVIGDIPEDYIMSEISESRLCRLLQHIVDKLEEYETNFRLQLPFTLMMSLLTQVSSRNGVNLQKLCR